ncbi:S1 family peptidase [Motilimonas eburnea]|uniref:S1 family peptidase n=1 Tax=Motilimonas eburnea TaxID=1737488 RepID=UPI001E535348|nr:serine protease [Motilimonas eburnea]MCE2570822.1 serine protease [Motilimonas eburnea]
MAVFNCLSRVGVINVVMLSITLVSQAAHAEPRIVGGSAVTELNVGIASLQVWRGNVLYHFCGASLLSPHWLLTAAHCVNAEGQDNNRDGVEDSQLEVFFNATELSGSTDYNRRAKVNRVIIHPQFNPVSLSHDIALLHVINPINSQYNRLGSGSLSQFSFGNTDFTAYGWGADNQAGDHYPNYLKQVSLNYQPCPYSPLPNAVFCAGGQALQDTCFGDSGGPVMTETNEGRLQFGIVSFGAADACGLTGLPAAFTYVPEYLSWIAQQQAPLLWGNAPIFEQQADEPNKGLSQPITLTNTSDQAVVITQVQLSPEGILEAEQGCIGHELMPQQSCTLNLAMVGDILQVHQIELAAFGDNGAVARLAFSIAAHADNRVAPVSRGGGGVMVWWGLACLLLISCLRSDCSGRR